MFYDLYISNIQKIQLVVRYHNDFITQICNYWPKSTSSTLENADHADYGFPINQRFKRNADMYPNSISQEKCTEQSTFFSNTVMQNLTNYSFPD